MADDQRADLVRKMIAEGTSDDDIRATLKVYDSQHAAAPAAEPQGDLGRFSGYKAIGDAVMTAGKYALEHPVQALAMAGGALGAAATAPASVPAALVGMAGAGLGAAGGAGIGSVVNAIRGGQGGPKTAGDVAATMATEGALGAAGEGLGRGAAAVAQKAGKLVYKTALRPSIPLQRDFGDIAEVGLREGLPVSEGGAKAAGAAPIQPKGIAIDGGIKDVNQRAALRVAGGRPDERPMITGRLQAMAARNPNGIDIEKAQAMKGEFQDLANRVYRAEDRGAPVLDLSGDTDAAIARGLRAQIGKSAEAVGVPGVHGANERTQELIGLTRAMEDANRRNVPGVTSVRALLGDFIPSVSSRLGIYANRAGKSGVLPATLRTAVLAALGGED